MSIPFYSNLNMNENEIENAKGGSSEITTILEADFATPKGLWEYDEGLYYVKCYYFNCYTSKANLTNKQVTMFTGPCWIVIDNASSMSYSKRVSVYAGDEVFYCAYNNLGGPSANQFDFKYTKYLAKDNTSAYTPTADYHPATKKYVDDNINSLGSSDYKINEPVLIGTWIDKPLYRTTQVVTLDTNITEDNTITLDDLTDGTSIPVHIYGYTYLSSADKVIYFDNHKNTAGTTMGIYIAEYHPSTRILDYYIAPNTAGEIRAEGGNTELYFIIEYFENN